MKILRLLINSNVYIASAAVLLAIATQVQVGMSPDWHAYLFLIFFATLFEYNLYPLISLLTKNKLTSDKYNWIKNNVNLFYFLVALSVVCFLIAVLETKLKILIALIPIAGLTLFYSFPISKNSKSVFTLRQIPYLKIFLISIVWSVVTVLLPLIHSEKELNNFHLLAIIVERFLFIFSITIPFDLRDMEIDCKAGLKTIPLKLGEQRAFYLSLIAIVFFLIISIFHYFITKQWFLIYAFLISSISTIFFLCSKRLQRLKLYHYGIMDGTMLFQGLLVLGFYYISLMF